MPSCVNVCRAPILKRQRSRTWKYLLHQSPTEDANEIPIISKVGGPQPRGRAA